jgi:hypothetical protein
VKCPGVNVHCPGCKSGGVGFGVILVIIGAIMYGKMDTITTDIAAFFRLLAEIVVGTVGVIVVSILAVIAVKITRRRHIYAVHKPANAVEYHRIRRAITRNKLVSAGIIKTVQVSPVHTMKEIPPKMNDKITAEILESSHMILPKWARK